MAAARMRLSGLPILLIAALLLSCGHPERTPNSTVFNKADNATRTASDTPCLNLNRATIEELAELPGIGEVMSHKIIEYRERHGPFRRPEEMIIIEGFSERKYRPLAGLVCVE
jgi:competence ComEA-like helix-hairpin-helix protein